MSKTDTAINAWYRRTDAVFDPKVIHKHLVAHYGTEIIETIIASAKAGIGPKNRPFPDYAPSYKKRLAKLAEQGKAHPNWLRSAGRPGRTTGMLAQDNFSFRVSPKGRLFIVWRAADHQMGIYAEVHQEGLKIGAHGPRRKRRWMHIESAASDRVVLDAYEKTIDDLCAMSAAGRMPK